MHLARFGLIVQPFHRPVHVQAEQLFGGGFLFHDRAVSGRIERQQSGKVDHGAFRAALDGLLRVGRQPDAAGSDDAHLVPPPDAHQIVVQGAHGVGRDEVLVLVAQAVDVQNVDALVQKVGYFLLYFGSRRERAD